MRPSLAFFIFFIALFATEAVANDPATPDILLAWEMPTTREDGSALDSAEIQGYKLYITYNTDPEQTVNIPAGTHSYSMVDVAPGTYQFQVSTIAETEGQRSAMINNTVQPTQVIIAPSAPITRVIIERCDPDGSNCTQEVIQ